MLKFARRYWLLALATLTIAAAVWVVDTSSTFRTCIDDNTRRQGDDKTVNEGPSILLVAASYSDCLGHFVDQNTAAITALATLVIAAFTGTLWFSTNQQARLTREIIDLARKDFVTSHPPKLAIRYIHLISHETIIDLDNVETFEVGFTVENIGVSAAKVTQSMIGICYYEAPLPCPPEFHKFGHDVLKDFNFNAGETRFFTASNDVTISVSAEPYFIGWAEYVDSAGSTRTLRFCRQYQFRTERFVLVNDPEYEQKDDC